MTDILCALMGLLDVVAGVVILITLFSHSWAIVLGALLILKGVMSFMSGGE